MILGRLTPWDSPRQRQLLRAGLHRDPAKARRLAESWFTTFDLDDVRYPEHRLLVHLRTRFPDLDIPATADSRIAGLKRQLWVRGSLNLKTVRPALDMLDDFGIGWVLTGAAQWFVRPGLLPAQSADLVEITVPENARSTALHLLAQAGWQREYTTPEAPAGPVFTRLSKGTGALKLSAVGPLFAYAPDHIPALWQQRVTQDHDTGRFYLPDAQSTLCMALGRGHPQYARDDQWLFDLFNLHKDPLALLAKTPLPVPRKIPRTLRGEFYR